eukprot:scaffold5928_cov115-Skeletonema_dohrnii-CCMP3373.AAC.3
MMSGVLESSHQALSIGRIVGLIGRLFANQSGQKGCKKVTGSLQITPTAGISHPRSKFDQNTISMTTIGIVSSISID